MDITTGPLGLSIPVQNPNAGTKGADGAIVPFSPATILSWRNSLEMTDLSLTTKKLYQLLCEISGATLGPKDRLEILELLRPTVQFIVQSLSRHYSHQPHALKQEQFTIANLSQSLQLSMAYGYKTIIEQTADAGASAELRLSLLPIAIQRVFHYFAQILLRSYKIYSPPPSHLWRELHLLYRYVHQALPNRSDLIDEYKHILLFAGSYPAKLRQNEQEALYRGTEQWISLASLGTKIPNTTGMGYLIIDIQADHGPIHPSRGQTNFSENCEVLSVQAVANRLKNLITTIEPDELQSRVAHENQAEYAIPLSVLRNLVQVWGQPSPRIHERTPQNQSASLCAGLRATHFYVNHGQAFQIPKIESSAQEPGQTPWVTEAETTDEVGTHIDFSAASITIPADNTELYAFYPCTIVNETPTGYALVLGSAIFSVLEAGEILGIRSASDSPDMIEICGIRWLQYEGESLRMGVERLSMMAKAGAVQLIKNKKPVGDYVRCLILESSLLVPTLPFKIGDRVNLLESEFEKPTECLLNELTDATGGYKRFKFKRTMVTTAALPPVASPAASNVQKTSEASTTSSDKKDPFDDIWSHL